MQEKWEKSFSTLQTMQRYAGHSYFLHPRGTKWNHFILRYSSITDQRLDWLKVQQEL